MKKLILSILLISFISPSVFASALDLGYARDDGGQAGAFLSWGAGARSLGMGRAFVALADDASAPYWNPAGLTQLRRKEITSLYASLWENTGYSFISYGHPTDKLISFGFSLVNLHSTNFEETDRLGYVTGRTSLSETALLVSMSYPVKIGFYGGLTLKFIQQKIGSYSDNDTGLDIGVLYKFGEIYKNKFLQGLSAGLNLRNVIAPQINLKDERDVYPLDLNGGLAYKLFNDALTLAVDWEKIAGRSLSCRYGTEYLLNEFLALRLGINENELGGGVGLKWKDFQFDYALGYHNAIKGLDDLGLSHRFNFSMRFGREFSTVEELKRRMLAQYYRKGIKYLQTGEQARAILEFNKILKIDPLYKDTLEKMEQASKQLQN
ncbi:MAG: PorV/PorQ family protein [Elusimicrobiota bacterium]